MTKAILLSLLSFLASIAMATENGGFLFVTFNGEKTPMGEQIHFALSKDGKSWEALHGGEPVLVSEIGEKGVRDPYMIRSHDGKKFYIVATDLSINRNHNWKRATQSGSKSIVIWESEDLVHWSEPRLVQVSPDDAGCTWAPEAVFDEKTGDYLVYWASMNGSDKFAKQRIWAARTKDFKIFSKPFIYIDKPHDVIDTDIVRENGKYYRFSKDESFKAITMEVATSPEGPWADVPGFSLAMLQGYEGPCCFKLQGGEGAKPSTWCLLLDHYAKGEGYKPFVTTNLASGNFVPASDVHFPFRFRHGGVLPLTSEEYDRIKAANAQPPANGADQRVSKPILDGFRADPDIRVFGDTYYVYPTSDKPDWKTTDFSCWSSKDLIHWKNEGVILDVAHNLSWANIKAWAPTAAVRNGKYYLYFVANGRIGVATSDKPNGTFADALGHPLIDAKTASFSTYPIDPDVFIDDDCQAYLYYGNGHLAAVKLKPDMISLDGTPVEITPMDIVHPFREGIFVIKRNGIYYFMWSVDDARSDNYRVAYGMSRSPFGPIEIPKDNIILQKHGLVKGTGHHGVINVPGSDRWYMAYHRHAIPDGNGCKREVCLARMEFNQDGTIKPVDALSMPFKEGDLGEPILRHGIE